MRNRCFASWSLALLAGIVLLPQAGLADDSMPIKGTFAVSYMRPSAVDYCNGAAGTVAIEAQGIGRITGLGPLFMTVKKCFTFSTLKYAGVFMLSSGAGDTLTGTYAGTQALETKMGSVRLQARSRLPAGRAGSNTRGVAFSASRLLPHHRR